MALSKFVVAPLGTQEGPPPDNYAVFYYSGIVDDYPWQLDEEQSVGDLSFLEYGDVLPMFQLEWIDEGTQALVQIGSLATGDLPNLYDRPAIVPAAVSSQLDDTGEERIHVAHVIPTVLQYIPPQANQVVVWGRWTGGGGIYFDDLDSFNSEMNEAAQVSIVSYYTPELGPVAADEYPPAVDPLPVNLDIYTEVELDEAMSLTYTDESWGAYWSVPYSTTSPLIPDGVYYAKLLIDDEIVIGVIRNTGGVQ